MAETRTAGTKNHVASSKPSNSKNHSPSKNQLIQMEAYGLAKHFSQGGLGIDMWNDTDRSFIQEKLQCEFRS